MNPVQSLPTPSRRLLLALAGALPVAAVPVVASAAPEGDDAAVVRLADEIMAIHAETTRLSEEAEAVMRPGKAKDRFRQDRIWPLVDRHWELISELAMTPATTMAGFRAKARVVQEFNNCSPGYAEPCHDDAMAWSLANDLLGVPSEWAEEADEAEAGE